MQEERRQNLPCLGLLVSEEQDQAVASSLNPYGFRATPVIGDIGCVQSPSAKHLEAPAHELLETRVKHDLGTLIGLAPRLASQYAHLSQVAPSVSQFIDVKFLGKDRGVFDPHHLCGHNVGDGI